MRVWRGLTGPPVRRLIAVASLGLIGVAGCTDPGWQDGDGFRWRRLAPAEDHAPGFRRLDPDVTGVSFANQIDPAAVVRQRAVMGGAGVAAGDVNGDELPDLFFAGTSRPNALYLNEGGARFREVPDAGGASGEGKPGAGAALADTDGDGDLDLVLTAVGDLRLYENDGHGSFTDVSAARGVTSTAGNTTAALADIEGDGDLDMYVSTWRRETMRDEGAPRLERTHGGYEIPARLTDRLEVRNGAVIEKGEPDTLFVNDGDGSFTAASWTDGRFLDEDGRALAEAPTDWGLTAAFHDVNGDGAPDLYVANDFDSPDRFWINDGDGRFRAVDRDALGVTSGSSMGVDFADVNRDGEVDFFVDDMLSSDREVRQRQMPAMEDRAGELGVVDERIQVGRNTLQVARGDGSYAEAALMAGVEATDWSWATAFLDVDLDGYEDLLVANGHMYDMLDADSQKPRPAPTTEDDAAAGLDFAPLETANVVFRNTSAADDSGAPTVGFERATAWGFDEQGITHGMALADLDADGDLDVVTNNLDEPAGIYLSEGSAGRLAVRLRGRGENTNGIGAKVRLAQAGMPEQAQEVIAGGRYLSGSEPLLSFAAAGTATSGQDGRAELTVDWPSGARSRVPDPRAGVLYEIREPERGEESAVAWPWAERGEGAQPAAADLPPVLVEDVSDRLSHRHHEDLFDDFAVQALLPRRLSTLGPGVAWADVDGNGADDLIVGAGRGGTVGVFLGDGKGAFNAVAGGVEAGTDVTGLAAAADGDGVHVLAGVSTWEVSTGVDGSPDVSTGVDGLPMVVELGAAARVAPDAAAASAGQANLEGVASAGPVAIADVEGDGDLDVFVGGRVVPGRYPEAAPSRLRRRNGGELVDEPEDRAALASAGLVSGAVWTDLDRDGLPELVLAREWASPAVYWNMGGRLEDATASIRAVLPESFASSSSDPAGGARSLAYLTGWWNGVTAADLDADGDMDLVLTNWGTNSEPRASETSPASLLHADLDADGRVETVEVTLDDAGGEFPTRRLQDLGRGLPVPLARRGSFAEYARTTLGALLPEHYALLERSTVIWPRHVTLMNDGSGKGFEVRPLPWQAQLAPAYGVNAADFNGDGNIDVFLAQNFRGQRAGQGPASAGRSVVLLGDGTGGLRAASVSESGISISGDGRGSAVADYDADGRPDIAVAQNGAPTRLFRGASGEAQLRVRLTGPEGNPAAIGAVVQVPRSGGLFTAEIHAGSGYWSSDSATVLVPVPSEDWWLWVRWPGGIVTEHDVPAGTSELDVSAASGRPVTGLGE